MSGTEAKVASIPDCDLCKHMHKRNPPHNAVYDGKTQMGPWAYMCEEDFQAYGVGLGTGRGQKLVLQ